MEERYLAAFLKVCNEAVRGGIGGNLSGGIK